MALERDIHIRYNIRASHGHGRLVYSYLYNQWLTVTPLKLWVWIQLTARCTWYNNVINFVCDCDRSMVFSEYFGKCGWIGCKLIKSRRTVGQALKNWLAKEKGHFSSHSATLYLDHFMNITYSGWSETIKGDFVNIQCDQHIYGNLTFL